MILEVEGVFSSLIYQIQDCCSLFSLPLYITIKSGFKMPSKVQPKKNYVRRSQAERDSSEREEQARKRKRQEVKAEEKTKKKPIITGGCQKVSLDHKIWGCRRPSLKLASGTRHSNHLALKEPHRSMAPVAPEGGDAVEQARKQGKVMDMEDVEGSVKSKGKIKDGSKNVVSDETGAGSGRGLGENVEVEEKEMFNGDYETFWQTYLTALEMACPPGLWKNIAVFLAKEIGSDASSPHQISTIFEQFRA